MALVHDLVIITLLAAAAGAVLMEAPELRDVEIVVVLAAGAALVTPLLVGVGRVAKVMTAVRAEPATLAAKTLLAAAAERLPSVALAQPAMSAAVVEMGQHHQLRGLL